MKKFLICSTVLAFSLLMIGAQARAQEVTLRVHHFMSPMSNWHTRFLEPLAERLAQASEGRIKLELFAAMSLGGRPGDLYDQAADGAVDIILTLPGYTAGRFPQAEVFELPFMIEDPMVASKAYWDLIESDLQYSDFDEVQVLAGWVHGPGLIHSKTPITRLEDLKGMEIRGPTRLVTDLLGELGASPVGMPLPKIPENISKGVISGAAVPWEIVPSIKLAEMVRNHTEMSDGHVLYTAIFVLAMNQEAYDDLPDDLRKILDAETGKALAIAASKMVKAADAASRKAAMDNNIIVLDDAEVKRWIAASKPVYDRWIATATKAGFDGAAAIARAKDLLQRNQ